MIAVIHDTAIPAYTTFHIVFSETKYCLLFSVTTQVHGVEVHGVVCHLIHFPEGLPQKCQSWKEISLKFFITSLQDKLVYPCQTKTRP